MVSAAYYQDREYQDWVVISIGHPAVRTRCPSEADLFRRFTEAQRPERIGSPPTSNPNWYWNGKHWRMEPSRGLSFWREGMHGILGALVGLMLALSVSPALVSWYARIEITLTMWGAIGGVVITAVSVAALITWLFLRYEETEEAEIRDWAYRDIGGYMAGITMVGMLSVAVMVGFILMRGVFLLQ